MAVDQRVFDAAELAYESCRSAMKDRPPVRGLVVRVVRTDDLQAFDLRVMEATKIGAESFMYDEDRPVLALGIPIETATHYVDGFLILALAVENIIESHPDSRMELAIAIETCRRMSVP